MISVNIHEAKTHLSRYLDRVEQGESITLCKRNKPIAEIRPLPSRPSQPRRFGGAKGLFTVPSAFFEPLPDEMLKVFHGE